MIRLVTYSDHTMTKSLEICCLSASKQGVEVCWPQNPNTINQEFKDFNKDIFAAERGAGYWLWKPYHIYKAMLQCQEGDILIYADAGVEFINSVKHIIERMDEDVFLFTNTHPQFHWCKREVMLSMNVPETLDIGQVQASIIFFKVTEETRNFVKKWLLWCQMPNLINDHKWMPQCKEFQDHRHDQAILTNIAYLYNYKFHWWPTVYAEHIRVAGDTYPVMFNHHRKRDNEW